MVKRNRAPPPQPRRGRAVAGAPSRGNDHGRSPASAQRSNNSSNKKLAATARRAVHASGDERTSSNRGGGRRRQQQRRSAHADATRPSRTLIPRELDEDIDDDLAFNSDDEAMYGHFFAHKRARDGDDENNNDDDDDVAHSLAALRRAERRTTATTQGSRTKKSKKSGNDDDDDALYNYHEEGQTSDEDGDEYIDLSDMLDRNLVAQGIAVNDDDDGDDEAARGTDKHARKAKQQKQPKQQQQDERSRRRHGATAATVATEDGRRVAKKRRGAALTDEAESLYGTSSAGDDALPRTYSAALRTMMTTTTHGDGSASAAAHDDDGDGGDDAVQASRQRLRDALHNTHMLLSVDEDESTKRRLTRRAVRAAVDDELHRYAPILRELSTTPHLQLPFAEPQSTPTVQSLGGIVATAEARLLHTTHDKRDDNNDKNNTSSSGKDKRGNARVDDHDDNDGSHAAHRLAQRTHALLSRAGLAPQAAAARRTHNDDNNDDAASSPRDGLAEHIAFDDHDDQTGGAGHAHHARPHSGDAAPTASYMAKLKAMLSYENERRRRFNKIKSKTYRRILRKEKEHEKERRQKAFELLHPELARRRLAAQLLRARAEERVTQKHKNTSAWVKHVRRFAGHDAQAREALQEQLATHQQLMSRMDTAAGEEMYATYVAGHDGDDQDEDEERVVDQLIEHAKQQQQQPSSQDNNNETLLARVLGQRGDNDGGDSDNAAAATTPTARARAELLQMRFMQAAREREKAAYAEQLQALQEDIRRVQRGEAAQHHDHDDNDDSDGDDEAAAATARRGVRASAQHVGAVVRVAPGRWSSSEASTRAHGDGDDTNNNNNNTHTTHTANVTVRVHAPSGIRVDTDNNNDGDDSTSKATTTTTSTSDDAVAAATTPSQFAGDRAPPRSRRVRVLPRTTTTTTTTAVAATTDSTATAKTRKTAAAATLVAKDDDNNDNDNDDEQQQQAYLVARAFAHDDVDADFVREKTAQVEHVMKPTDRNESLPGWGEWGGEDARLNARHREKVAHSNAQRAIARSFLLKSRADAHLDHVIINHDGVELVPDRMTLHMVPRPFANAQEFARSLRQPTGPEWTSALTFKEMVQPRVEVRQGHSVAPLDLSLRRKQRKTSRRKRDLDAVAAAA